MTIMMIVMSKVLPSIMMKNNAQGQGMGLTEIEIIMNKIQAAHIMKLALVEGAALLAGMDRGF